MTDPSIFEADYSTHPELTSVRRVSMHQRLPFLVLFLCGYIFLFHSL